MKVHLKKILKHVHLKIISGINQQHWQLEQAIVLHFTHEFVLTLTKQMLQNFTGLFYQNILLRILIKIRFRPIIYQI